MAILQYDNIVLPHDFPFEVSDKCLPAHYDMDGIMHWHDCFEISAVWEGHGEYQVSNTTYPVGPGDIIIFNNVEPHQLIVGDREMRQTVITFQSGLLYNGMSSIDDFNCIAPFMERNAEFKNLISSNSPCTTQLLRLIKDIIRESLNKESGWRLMIKADLLAVLTLLSRHFGDKIGNSFRRQHLLKLQPVFRYIEENYQNELTLPECAAMIPFTPQYFSSYFKQTTGTKFIDYLISVRIQHAIRMLRSSEHTIMEIALDCGFNNMGNFIALFKSHTGMTPSAFRKAHRAKQ